MSNRSRVKKSIRARKMTLWNNQRIIDDNKWSFQHAYFRNELQRENLNDLTYQIIYVV